MSEDPFSPSSFKWGNYIAEKPNVALELGCEGGRWSKLLSDMGWRMICTDIDPKTLSVCKNKVPTATTILVDPDDSRIPSDSETIGLLLCIEVFEVMPCEWFVDETFRVLLNKALVVGIFLNRLSFRGIYRHFNARLHRSYDFYRLSYPAWRRKMSSICALSPRIANTSELSTDLI